MTALIVIDNQLVLLLSRFGLIGQWTALLFVNQALKDGLRQNFKFKGVVLFRSYTSSSDRQMAERMLAFEEDQTHFWLR